MKKKYIYLYCFCLSFGREKFTPTFLVKKINKRRKKKGSTAAITSTITPLNPKRYTPH